MHELSDEEPLAAIAAASIVLRSDRPDKALPLGTKTDLRPGERTGIKGMGCQPGSVVTIPANTPPGTYTLVATCPRPQGAGNYLGQYRTTITVARA